MQGAVRHERFPLSALPEDIAAQWRQLCVRCDANPSLHPDWVDATARSHDLQDVAHLLCAFEADTLVAAIPLYIRKRRTLGMRLPFLELVTNVSAYDNRPVSALSPEVTIALLAHEARRLGAVAIQLEMVPEDSELGGMLITRSKANHTDTLCSPSDSSPVLELAQSWDAQLASKSKKFRYKTRKRIERIETDQNLRMAWVRTPDAVPGFLEEVAHIEHHSWKEDTNTAIFQNASETRLYEMLLPGLVRDGHLLANVLYADHEPIAYSMCCRWGDWVGQMKTSYDARHSDLSPGLITVDAAIRRSIELGARTFDFLGGPDPYKLAWTKTVRNHANYTIYLKRSPRGQLVNTLQKVIRKRHGTA